MSDRSAHAESVCESVSAQLVDVLTSAPFRAWLGSERARAGDLIILNNSFLHRDGIANRSKSNKYLCVAIEPDGQPSLDICVAISKNRINNRFKRVPQVRTGDYAVRLLKAAVIEELSDLGTIVFAIAGRIGEDLSVSVTFPDADGMSMIQYVPDQPELVVIMNGRILINRLDDIDIVWRAVAAGASASGIPDTSRLSAQFEKSFEELRELAARPVHIDEVSEESPSIITEIISRLGEQVGKYREALDTYVSNTRDNDAMNELLRIAYNFADGAGALVTLVVRMSDIKPVLCWLTMTAQSELTDRFADLPFSLVGRAKPSISQYRALVAGARNRAFHDIFAFGQPFQVALTGDAFRDAELRLFQEYGTRSRPGLEYRDRELVDLLSGFTRTAERPVPLGFWEGNLEVMQAVLSLAQSLRQALLLVAPRPTPTA